MQCHAFTVLVWVCARVCHHRSAIRKRQMPLDRWESILLAEGEWKITCSEEMHAAKHRHTDLNCPAPCRICRGFLFEMFQVCIYGLYSGCTRQQSSLPMLSFRSPLFTLPPKTSSIKIQSCCAGLSKCTRCKKQFSTWKTKHKWAIGIQLHICR